MNRCSVNVRIAIMSLLLLTVHWKCMMENFSPCSFHLWRQWLPHINRFQYLHNKALLITTEEAGYQTTGTPLCCPSYCSPVQCFTGFTKGDQIGINYTTSSFWINTLETVHDTCAKVTFVNFLCNCLACFRDFSPGLTGRSILGVLIFALAVIKISLKLNMPTKLTQC